MFCEEPEGPLGLVGLVNVLLWPIKFPLKLEHDNSLMKSLLLAIGQLYGALHFRLQLLDRTMLLPIFAVKWNLETLHYQFYIRRVIKFKSLAHAFLDNFLVVNILIHRCFIRLE